MMQNSKAGSMSFGSNLAAKYNAGLIRDGQYGSPGNTGIDRTHDVPWVANKLSVFRALKALGATDPKSAVAGKSVILKTGGAVTDKHVRHYCYHGRAAGLTDVVNDERPYRFYITRKGMKELAEFEKSASPRRASPVEPIARKKSTHEKAVGYAQLSDIEGLKTEYRLVKAKRSRKVRNAAFAQANGLCAVCDRDFSKVLGGRGVRVLQAHHREQLSARKAPSVTEVTDLAIVCANCHLLLHLDSHRTLSVAQLRKMLREDDYLNRAGTAGG